MRTKTVLFRIAEIIVKDKDLPKFLLAAAPYVDAMSVPQPVVNAELRNGKVSEVTEGGTTSDLFMQHLVSERIKDFDSLTAQKWLESIGRSPATFQGMLQRLKKEKRVKFTTRGHYTRIDR